MSSSDSVSRGLNAVADKVRRVARTWSINTVNTAVYILSGGERVLHEGRFSPGTGFWSSWNRAFHIQPQRFETPESEEEICRIVKESARLRAVGGGHSFNASPLTGGTVLSLDKYAKILSVDVRNRLVRVQAGIRLRDLTAELLKHGLALPVQGSTDAQSMAGLIATDVHGTGRDAGFLSTNIRSIRLVDGEGRARTLEAGDEAFHAVLGGMGACGVVIEAEIACVDAFNLRKSVTVVRCDWVARHIDEILAEHHHVSFYYIAGVQTEHVRMNTWDHTVEPPSSIVRLHKMRLELVDMLVSGYLLGLAKVLDISDITASLGLLFFKLTMNGHHTVYPAREGFSRKLFYNHDELEYGVPYDKHRACLAEVMDHLADRRFLTIVEVRFTPDQSKSLLGPGAGRRTCFIELAPSLSVDASDVFADVEKILWKYGGQLHLGKATRANAKQMEAMYQERFARFRKLQRALDPTGKFINDFVAQLLEGASPRPSAQAHADRGSAAIPSADGPLADIARVTAAAGG